MIWSLSNKDSFTECSSLILEFYMVNDPSTVYTL